jgi:hypothetical protein
VNSGAPEGLIIPALLEAHIVLILLQVHWRVIKEERGQHCA